MVKRILPITAQSGADLHPALEGFVFVSVGLPAQLARELAGPYPVLDLRPEELAQTGQPEQEIALIACPLVSTSFDAMQITETLAAAGFAGRLLVVAPALPNVAMVERELQAIAPALTISVITP